VPTAATSEQIAAAVQQAVAVLAAAPPGA
jgi:hypothetical protein